MVQHVALRKLPGRLKRRPSTRSAATLVEAGKFQASIVRTHGCLGSLNAIEPTGSILLENGA